jgi:hypothetical protein
MKTLDIIIHLWRRSPRSGNCVYAFISLIFIEEKTWISFEKSHYKLVFLVIHFFVWPSSARIPVPSKAQENILLRRPPLSHTSSSQEGLSELLSDPVMRGKTSLSGASEGMDFSKSLLLPFSAQIWVK